MSVEFPTNWDEVEPRSSAELRAGGTDLSGRRHLRVLRGLPLPDLVDLRDLDPRAAIQPTDGGGLLLPATTRISLLASHAGVSARYPGLSGAAATLATPEIRAVATLAGNLLQSTRCSYFRNPSLSCFKSGGDHCPAREGDHLLHACFDIGPCVSVHPSTLGTALLAYDATIHLHDDARLSIEQLFRDGTDPRVDHHLPPDTAIRAVELSAPNVGERSAYVRTISRARAEWPMVEVAVRLTVVDGRIGHAVVALGGVAPRPRRASAVEQALRGSPATARVFERAALEARKGANPLPMTEYKADLLAPSVLEALERAAASDPIHTEHPSEETSE